METFKRLKAIKAAIIEWPDGHKTLDINGPPYTYVDANVRITQIMIPYVEKDDFEEWVKASKKDSDQWLKDNP